MGISEREFYPSLDGRPTRRPASSLVGRIIGVSVGIWILQALLAGADPTVGGPLTRALACSASDLARALPEIWRPLTALFVHDWSAPWHLAGNLLFLFVFGIELETFLGRREFLVLYLAAGVLSILAEVSAQAFFGTPETLVLGSSGAVLAIVILATCLEPKRQILVLFAFPVPVWTLAAFFVGQDVLRCLTGGQGVASVAHLCGALYGFLYWRFDLRIDRWLARRRRSRGPSPCPAPPQVSPPSPAPTDPISARIDRLLDRIHANGLDSLSPEEKLFLRENSERYGRDGPGPGGSR